MILRTPASHARASRTRHARSLIALLIGAAFVATPARAQNPVTTPPPSSPPMAVRYAAAVQGETARIQVIQPRGGWGTGTVAWTTSDSLGLQRTRQRDTVAIGRDNIAQFEVHRGTRASGAATAVGIVGGALVGLVIGGRIGENVGCRDNRCDDNPIFGGLRETAIGGLFGLAFGGFGGGMLGAQRRVPRWVPLPP